MILFGEQDTRIGNSGAGSLESYYGMVSHIQNVIARPALEKVNCNTMGAKKHIGQNSRQMENQVSIRYGLLLHLEIAQTKQARETANSTEVTNIIITYGQFRSKSGRS